MHLSRIRTLLLLTVGLISVSPLAAQNYSALEDAAPILAPTEPSPEVTGGPLQSVAAQPVAPTTAEAPTAEFRRIVQELRDRKHQYVHCKLKTGSILTGQVKSAGFEAFTIQTEALGGFHTVKYDDLAETPRAVPAVGTRFKQGAQWTGFGAVVLVAIPVLIVLSPFLFLSGMWDC